MAPDQYTWRMRIALIAASAAIGGLAVRTAAFAEGRHGALHGGHRSQMRHGGGHTELIWLIYPSPLYPHHAAGEPGLPHDIFTHSAGYWAAGHVIPGHLAVPPSHLAAHSAVHVERGDAALQVPLASEPGESDQANAAAQPSPAASPASQPPPRALGPGRPPTGQPGPGRPGPGRSTRFRF